MSLPEEPTADASPDELIEKLSRFRPGTTDNPLDAAEILVKLGKLRDRPDIARRLRRIGFEKRDIDAYIACLSVRQWIRDLLESGRIFPGSALFLERKFQQKKFKNLDEHAVKKKILEAHFPVLRSKVQSIVFCATLVKQNRKRRRQPTLDKEVEERGFPEIPKKV